MTIVSTTTRVQAASAMELVPGVSAQDSQAQASSDVPLSTGLVVPDQLPQIDQPIPMSAAPVSSPVTKKAWNKMNSADLTTIQAHSSEPALRTMTVPTTAYTSDPGETDASPFTTANGTRVHNGTIAANFLKFGTRVRIPDQFGDKVFIVEDRMNARYDRRVDIWMTNKADAYKWGVRNVRIEILP